MHDPLSTDFVEESVVPLKPGEMEGGQRRVRGSDRHCSAFTTRQENLWRSSVWPRRSSDYAAVKLKAKKLRRRNLVYKAWNYGGHITN